MEFGLGSNECTPARIINCKDKEKIFLHSLVSDLIVPKGMTLNLSETPISQKGKLENLICPQQHSCSNLSPFIGKLFVKKTFCFR